MKRLVLVVALFVIAGALAGCSKPPQADLDMAKAKLEEAKNAQAQGYAANEYRAAMDAMSAAEREISTQSSKFVLFRNFGQAKRLVASADSAAVKATQAAAEGKERMRVEVEGALAQVQAALDSTQVLLGKAPKGKETRAELELIKNDVAAAVASLEEARASYNQQDYLTARSKVMAVRDKANSLMSELTAAIEKARGGRRK